MFHSQLFNPPPPTSWLVPQTVKYIGLHKYFVMTLIFLQVCKFLEERGIENDVIQLFRDDKVFLLICRRAQSATISPWALDKYKSLFKGVPVGHFQYGRILFSFKMQQSGGFILTACQTFWAWEVCDLGFAFSHLHRLRAWGACDRTYKRSSSFVRGYTTWEFRRYTIFFVQ